MEEPVHEKIAALRLACAREIETSRCSMEFSSLLRSLSHIRSKTDLACTDLEKLWKIMEQLHVLDEDLEKALSVKASKEKKHQSVGDRISAAKARIEELEKIVQNQQMRRDEYAAVIAQQSLALEKRCNPDESEKEHIEAAISWYHRILGFQAIGGDGVKFVFTKINPKNIEEEFSVTIRIDGDKYSLIQCNPSVQNLSKMVEELNQTNGLHKFVRTMRSKFQTLVLNERTKDVCQDATVITSASSPPMSADSRCDSVTAEYHADADQPIKEQSHIKSPPSAKKTRQSHIKSPPSQLHLRRSPRLHG